ncbi:glyoxalase [Bacillus coahuilensis p1.1.43]|uniref:Glyoxalase n=1 Tax=Bacillus coahuilensis p1.1.43 TaxID=1150625 RepID=A0A147K3V0_9BACI|nr:VOC family protein [Bacillus coahuilensis]KUP03930.1 glyoxalase [Bacillus coahuilensis p1.1.43]
MSTQPIQKVHQIGMNVKDIKRAVHFYQEKLGLSLLFQMDTMAFFECQGLRLMLTLPEKEKYNGPSSVFYFQVEDIEEASRLYREKGIHFVDTPHLIAKMGNTETWMTFFHDSEENTHALMSEVTVTE